MSNLGLTNLSERPLSPLEKLVLSQGLRFIPRPPDVENSSVFDGFQSFARSIRLRKAFANSDTSTVSKLSLLLRIPNPSYQPPCASPFIEDYISSVHTKLSADLDTVQVCYSCYPKFFIETIRSLRADKSIIIKNCDKNLGVCVVSRSWYESECFRQLSDTSTYQRLTISPATPIDFDEIYDDVEDLLRRYNLLFQSKNKYTPLAKYILQLKGSNAALARFYLLIKIHKSPVVGRPICASINTRTYHASRYLAAVLQPFAERVPTYLRNSTDLLLHIENSSFPQDVIFLTADICELYPSIDLADGLAALHTTLSNSGLPPERVDFLVALTSWVLHNNFFEFGDTFWKQVKGTAMGTPLAVAFAVIYLSVLEDEVLRICILSEPSFVPPLLLKRYIDDLFALFYTRTDAELFISVYKSRRSSIRLTHDISNVSGVHQDIEIFKGDRFSSSGRLDMRLYIKPVNQFLYLPGHSFHSTACKKAFVQAELARARLRFTSDEEFTNYCSSFRQRLVHRGYKPNILLDWFSALPVRELLLSNIRAAKAKKVASTASSNPLVFKLTYTPRSLNLHLRQCLAFTDSIWYDMDAKYIFDESRPPILCLKRTRNLGEFVTASKHVFV